MQRVGASGAAHSAQRAADGWRLTASQYRYLYLQPIDNTRASAGVAAAASKWCASSYFVCIIHRCRFLSISIGIATSCYRYYMYYMRQVVPCNMAGGTMRLKHIIPGATRAGKMHQLSRLG